MFSFTVDYLLREVRSLLLQDTASYLKQPKIIDVFVNLERRVRDRRIDNLFGRVNYRGSTCELIVLEHLVLFVLKSLNDLFLFLVGREYQILQRNIWGH